MPTTYNQKDIQQWLADRQDLPDRMETQRKNIADLDEKLTIEKKKRDGLVSQRLNPLEDEISLLTAQINVITLPPEINELTVKLAGQQADLSEHRRQLELTIANLKPIESEIHQVEHHLQLLGDQQRLSELNIKYAVQDGEWHTLQNSLTGMRAELANLNARSQAIRNELNQLQTPPVTPPPPLPNPSGYSSSQSQPQYGAQQGGYSSSQSSGYGSSQGNRIETLKAELAAIDQQKSHLDKNIHRAESSARGVKQHLGLIEFERTQLRNNIQTISYSLGTFSSMTSSYMLQSRLDNLQQRRNPLLASKHQLEASIESKAQAEKSTRLTLEGKQLLLTQSKNTANHHPQRPLADLENDLTVKNADKKTLLREKAIYDKQISEINTDKREHQATLSMLTRRQKEVTEDDYLDKLTSQPDTLYGEMVARINAQINAYEVQHPANQSLGARMSLVDLQKQLSDIASATTLPTDFTVCNTPEHQRYYRLTGLLWKLHARNQTEDPNFAATIKSMLGPKALDAVESAQSYQHLQAALDIRDITAEELLSDEEAAYKATAANLQGILNQPTDYLSREVKAVYREARTVLKTFNKEVASASSKNNDDFDLKYHTTILKKVSEIVQNPEEKRLLTECKALCSHNTHGKPSLGKKIGGAIMTFLGAAAIAAGVYLSVTSLGFAAPLSIGLIAGGNALVISGVGLFHHGRTKGDERNLLAFNKAAGKVPAHNNEDNDAWVSPVPSAPLLSS